MKSFKIKIIICLSLILLLGAVPQSAHALLSLINVSEIAQGAVLGTINVILDFLLKAVGMAISELGKILQSVINLKVTTGGSPVYTIWKLMQSFANMGFIVALILMSFGTIFDTLKLPFIGSYSVRQPKVIPGFLIAALVVNFSLAIGQVVTETSNKLSSVLLTTLQVRNISEQVGGSLGIASTILEASAPKPIAVIDNVPESTLTEFQKAALAKFPPQARAAIDSCMKNNEAHERVCFSRGQKIAMDANIAAQKPAADAEQKKTGFFNNIIYSPDAFVQWVTGGPYAKTVMAAKPLGSGSPVTPLVLIHKLFQFFMLLVLFLSFLVVFIFMFVRIPFIWILLALSPIAWASKAFPGATLFDDWWKEFWKWNMFSPLYILVIGLGVFALEQMNGLVASMSTQNVPLIMGFLTTTLGYTLVAIIFIGGSAAVLKMATAGGTYASAALGNITGTLGVGGKYGAFAPAARLTGLNAGYETLKATAAARAEKLKQVGKSITDASPIAQAFRVKSYDEKLALARKRAGVLGADTAYRDLKKKQVDDEQAKLKQRMESMSKDQQKEFLKSQMHSSNRSIALAAREEMLKRNELKGADLERTKQMYGDIDPGARKAFEERARRAPGAAKREKKKAADERRDEIVATISEQDLSSLAKVQAALAPYEEIDAQTGTRKDEPGYQAALIAIGTKSPYQLFEHLKTTLPESDARLKAFTPILKNVDEIGELNTKYLTVGTDEHAALKQAITDRYSSNADAKKKAMQKAIDAAPEKLTPITSLFT